jgi:hypothetical protein
MPLRRLIFLASVILAATAMIPSAALAAAHGTNRPLTGTGTGTSTVRFITPSTAESTGVFTGHLSHLGAGTGHEALTDTFNFTDNTFSYTGTRTFVAANGDELFSTINGSGTFTSTTTAQSTENDTITGGTGRFAGASGTYTNAVSFVVLSATPPPNASETLRFAAVGQGQISY